MEKLLSYVDAYLKNHYADMIRNPLSRSRAIKQLIIGLLILNAIFFTNGLMAIYLQLFLALALFFYDLDDQALKDNFIKLLKKTKKDFLLTESLINKSDKATICIDEKNILYVYNDKASQILGFDSAEVLGKDVLRKIIALEIYSKFLSFVDNFFHNQSKATTFYNGCVLELKSKEGDLINVKAFFDLVEIENNKYMIITFQTEEHNEIVDSKSMYEQSRYAQMGEMIGNIAHQWRQPLTAISMIASSTKLNNQLGIATKDELDKSLDDIANYTNYLSQTIDVFRNYYSTEKIIKNFNLIQVINDVLNMLDANFKDNYIVVFKDFQSTNIECRGLPNELSQVLINILNNARDVLIENKLPNKNIKIVASKQDVNAVIEIYDNGGGINNSIVHKIFDPYFTTKPTKHSSSGMGLYMSKDIIENSMKGILKAENASFDIGGDKYFGACFTIKLPAIMG